VRNDRWLARQAARGDRDAFAAIFRRHEQDLYRYCVAILGDPEDAQDALQNAMVKALRALPGESREIALKPWLYRIAHNEAIELRRRERPSGPFTEDLPAPGTSLEESAADRERLRALLDDLGRLPERHRGALVMRELGGLDFEQIGAALETTPAAARQVLYEARRGLREMADGREMACEKVMETVSAADGRVSRRRAIRAHLRDCQDCRAFAAEIEGRRQALAGIAPLPAAAAAALLKGALGSVGGAAAGGGAAAIGSATPAGLGAAAGAATKAGGAATLVKATLGVAAIVAVGTVAADRGHLPVLSGGDEAPAAVGDGPSGGEGGSTSSVAVDATREERKGGARAGGLGPAIARESAGKGVGPGRRAQPAPASAAHPHPPAAPTATAEALPTAAPTDAAPGGKPESVPAPPSQAGSTGRAHAAGKPGEHPSAAAPGQAAKDSPTRPVHPPHPQHPTTGQAGKHDPGPAGSQKPEEPGGGADKSETTPAHPVTPATPPEEATEPAEASHPEPDLPAQAHGGNAEPQAQGTD
jgi:RNA polymerase sigma factor (sigma-70 family)